MTFFRGHACLSGREGALVDDILGVLLLDLARAVERGAGEGHETWVRNVVSMVRMKVKDDWSAMTHLSLRSPRYRKVRSAS